MRKISTIILLITSLAGLQYSCSTTRQKTSKPGTLSAIDTLAFLTPQIVIESQNSHSVKIEEDLSMEIREDVREIISATLRKKYQLLPEPLQITEFDNQKITHFFENSMLLRTRSIRWNSLHF
ncbi:hypothetical protein JKA74_14290 [Marivirga sp. S37H4]|uniref:Uncharacterized protein n=1 Tax=Marivirga aurantiaca TaxID=2802615 RepID=A0A934X0E7_9BACT|nr:hypothetical protein [Marivirga aurantiaca]MBK6266211.1 hypothetical protein [Marivirga aurantiaca]